MRALVEFMLLFHWKCIETTVLFVEPQKHAKCFNINLFIFIFFQQPTFLLFFLLLFLVIYFLFRFFCLFFFTIMEKKKIARCIHIFPRDSFSFPLNGSLYTEFLTSEELEAGSIHG